MNETLGLHRVAILAAMIPIAAGCNAVFGVESHGLAPDAGVDRTAGGPLGGDGSVTETGTYTLDGESASDSGCGVDGGPVEGLDPDSGMICGYTMPNPADAGLPNPATYTANPSDGTVKDNVTGLVWEANVDKFAQYTQEQALTHCASIGFRLPTRIELVSLVDFTQPNPTIDGTYFMNTPAQKYWTSSHFVCDPTEAYYVGFDQSGTHPTSISNQYQFFARCVKGAPTKCASTRYQIQADGSVLDGTRGLTWQRTFVQSTSWSNALTLCPSGWRLPSVNELQTIVDQNQQSPPIDRVAFPDTPSGDFWTSSPKAGDATQAWYVAFIHGHAATDSVTQAFWVRCVRP